MSDKLLLELYERIATLEEKVATLEKAVTGDTQIDCASDTETLSEVKGKYRYLSDYLLNCGKDAVVLSFSEIEEILGENLPPSTRQHRALWANTKSHSFALAWMNIGYRTADVDMKNETVRFEKNRVVMMANMETQQFHRDMLGIYDDAKKIGYNASYFLRTVSMVGGFEAARQLIRKETEGFTKLWELKRLDLTVEALIVRKWQSLFSADEVRMCQDRLTKYGYRQN